MLEDEHPFGYSGFHFRIALKRVEILNSIFPDLYKNHRDWLIDEYRNKLRIRDYEHQKEIMEILYKRRSSCTE